jgi:hypothetical protein
MLESQIRMLESKICIGGDAMSELRKEWTPEQVQEHRAEANESLPEARTTDRFPVAGRASGMDRMGGEELYEEDVVAAAEPGSKLWMPPDPPRRPTDQGGQ